jgi:MFS family permease
LLLYSFGVFVRPLATQFHWTRTQIAGALSIGQLMVAFTSPVWGLLVDRFGPRRIILTSLIGMSVGYASLAFLTPNLWHLYLVFALFTMLGGAASPVGYAAVLVRNFERHLGLALGLSLMGIGLGAVLLPKAAQLLIESHGWRGAYGAIGVATLLVTFPAALYATRYARTPVLRPGAIALPILPLVVTRAFVVMCIIFIALGLASGGVIANLVSMMIDRGFTASGAAGVASLAGLTVILGRGGIGWLLDKWNAARLLACIAILLVAAMLLLACVPGRPTSYIAALLIGSVLGAEVDFTAYLIRRYFGKAAFGRLYGLTFGIFSVGVAAGPLLLSFSFDRLHSFRPGLLLLSLLVAAAAALTFALPPFSSVPIAAEPAPIH